MKSEPKKLLYFCKMWSEISNLACEQALRWGLARDSRAQAVKRAARGLGRPAPNLSRLASPLAPENLARDPNGELARRLFQISRAGYSEVNNLETLHRRTRRTTSASFPY